MTLFVKQNKWHRYSVLRHTFEVTYQCIKHEDLRFVVPALLHDIGKPFVAFQDEQDILENTYSFTDHEEASYQMIKNWPLSRWTKDIVRYHYLIRDIQKCKEKGNIERLEEKTKIWNSLPNQMKKDIGLFMKYDDMGK